MTKEEIFDILDEFPKECHIEIHINSDVVKEDLDIKEEPLNDGSKVISIYKKGQRLPISGCSF